MTCVFIDFQIFVGYPASSRVLERSCEDKFENIMVKSLCKENYHQAAYAALKFPPFREELVKEVAKLVKGELKTYSEGPSTAKYNGDPLSLSQYNAENMLEDAEVNLPVLFQIVKGSVKSQAVRFVQNKQALMLSSFMNTWMPRSNFLYRINTLLIAGSCKTEIMDVFHRLGLSCHPNTIRRQLEAAAGYFDKDIMKWKEEIELNRRAVKLLEEVLKCQVAKQGDDSMDICSVDFSSETISGYKCHDDEAYAKCCLLLPNDTNLVDDDILGVIATLNNSKLPRYR